MGEHDRRRDRTDLAADVLGVVGGEEAGVAYQLDRVGRPPALAEGAHDPLPAGGALPRAVDQDDVARHEGAAVADSGSRSTAPTRKHRAPRAVKALAAARSTTLPVAGTT